MWQLFIARLDQVVGVLGVSAVTIIAVIVVLAAAVTISWLGYLSLKGGERALETLLPYMREAVGTLRTESNKTHPAVRLELRFHYVLASIIFFCLIAIVLHALIPWTREVPEAAIIGSLISAGVLASVLGFVSLRLSLRVK